MNASHSLSNPPWKKQVNEILQKNLEVGCTSSLSFSLATINPGPRPRPAVRTVGFGRFVGESDDTSPLGNPPADSSLILVSTDALMPKIDELEGSDGCTKYAGCMLERTSKSGLMEQRMFIGGIQKLNSLNPG